MSERVFEAERTCPLCGGQGCKECDHTGHRMTTYVEREDGSTLRISGTGSLSPELLDSLGALVDLAVERSRHGGAP